MSTARIQPPYKVMDLDRVLGSRPDAPVGYVQAGGVSFGLRPFVQAHRDLTAAVIELLEETDDCATINGQELRSFETYKRVASLVTPSKPPPEGWWIDSEGRMHVRWFGVRVNQEASASRDGIWYEGVVVGQRGHRVVSVLLDDGSRVNLPWPDDLPMLFNGGTQE